MTEYWVSRDKHWCTYCQIFISKDKPSISHHENGLRHKGNLERYIRNIYKTNKEEDKAKRERDAEIQRITAAANARTGEPSVPAKAVPKTSSSSTLSSTPAPIKPTNSYGSYSTPGQLGYYDEEPDKLKEEYEKRQQEGVPGEWTTVVRQKKTVRDDHTEKEVDDDEKDRNRHIHQREKVSKGLDDEEYDIGVITLKKGKVASARSQPESKISLKPIALGKSSTSSSTKSTKPVPESITDVKSEPKDKEVEESEKQDNQIDVKVADGNSRNDASDESKQEAQQPPTISLKKRKPPANARKNARPRLD